MWFNKNFEFPQHNFSRKSPILFDITLDESGWVQTSAFLDLGHAMLLCAKVQPAAHGAAGGAMPVAHAAIPPLFAGASVSPAL